MTEKTRAYAEMHFAVFLFGFTAILGDLIQLQASWIVWWRVLITSISLFVFIRLFQSFPKVSKSLLQSYFYIGILIALHWVAFYGSVKLANASIALLGMATTSLFTSFLEPMLLKTTFDWKEALLGFVIVPAMAFIISDLDTSFYAGLLVGILAALLASLFSILNKKYIGQTDVLTMTFFELSSAWLFLTIAIPGYLFLANEPLQWIPPTLADWIYLLVLSLLCTTLAYVLNLKALKHISAFASNLAINMEPVYGILLAWIILNDQKELNPTFYLGILIIILVVFSYPLVKDRLFKP